MANVPFLEELFKTVEERRHGDPETSHTARLFSRGVKKIAQKVGEEAVEVAIAATAEGKKELIAESADLIYHLMVLWAASGVTLEEIMQELSNRRGISGIAEKKARKKR